MLSAVVTCFNEYLKLCIHRSNNEEAFIACCCCVFQDISNEHRLVRTFRSRCLQRNRRNIFWLCLHFKTTSVPNDEYAPNKHLFRRDVCSYAPLTFLYFHRSELKHATSSNFCYRRRTRKNIRTSTSNVSTRNTEHRQKVAGCCLSEDAA